MMHVTRFIQKAFHTNRNYGYRFFRNFFLSLRACFIEAADDRKHAHRLATAYSYVE